MTKQRKSWAEIEAAFRLWAFHAFYRQLAEEKDMTVRFVKAVVKSGLLPIRSRKAVRDWYKTHRRKRADGNDE